MPGLNINIVAFDVPFPANYGGNIDVFYKLKTLHSKGVHIILHCFEYQNPAQKELEKYCSEVYYYPRKKGFLYLLSNLPYIVKTRNHSALLANLLQNKYPILFEGLHSCFYLNHPALKDRKKVVRAHNVEHEYYNGLQKSAISLSKKLYYLLEAKKLKRFEKVLSHAGTILSISESDQHYFENKFENATRIPAFHSSEKVSCKTGSGAYFLYHGKLSVEENRQAALFLIQEVFSKTNAKLIVAGSQPDNKLMESCQPFSNITLVPNPEKEKMEDLISNAQACVLPTFQATGLKLKLLISLFSSRFVIVNNEMINGTSLKETCLIANSAEEFIQQVNKIEKTEFNQKQIETRKKLLTEFENDFNGKKLLNLLENLSSNV